MLKLHKFQVFQVEGLDFFFQVRKLLLSLFSWQRNVLGGEIYYVPLSDSCIASATLVSNCIIVNQPSDSECKQS